MPLDDFTTVSIDASGTGITRVGFGTPLIAAAHSRYLDLVRSYATLDEMVLDGFVSTDPVYMAAAAVFAQEPRVERLKIGRRATAFTQIIDLTPDAVVTGKRYSVTVDGVTAFYVAQVGDNLAAVVTALAAAITTALAGVATAIHSGSSTAGPQTINAATPFSGSVGAGVMSPPRALSLVLNANASWLSTVITVTGTGTGGEVVTDTFTVPAGGNATVTGASNTLFRTVTQIAIPTQGGVNGTYTLGTRARATAANVGGTKVTMTATKTGTLVGVELAANMALLDATADPGLTADLDAIAAADNAWYGLLLDSNGPAEIMAAAAWAEPRRKLFVAQSADTGIITTGVTTDVGSTTKAAQYFHAAVEYMPAIARSDTWLAAGLLGSRLPVDPGTDTWAFKQLRGVRSYVLTSAQEAQARLRNVGLFTVTGGVAFTSDGKVASGEWADVVRGTDALRVRMQENVLQLLTSVPKVPFTDLGISQVGGVIESTLDAFTSTPTEPRLLADDPKPVVTVPKAAAVSPTDRGNRYLSGLRFSARLAGAVHKADIKGSVRV